MHISKKPDRSLYVGWILFSAVSILFAFCVYWLLISPINQILGDRIVVAGESRITEDFLLPYIVWPVLSLLNGLLQYLLLRRTLPRMGWWIVATAVGWSLALFGSRGLHYVALNAGLDLHPVWFSVAKIILTGGAIGFAQWILLRRRVRHADWWIVANLVGWGVSETFSDWLDLWVLWAQALVTGVALWLLLDRLPSRESRTASINDPSKI